MESFNVAFAALGHGRATPRARAAPAASGRPRGAPSAPSRARAAHPENEKLYEQQEELLAFYREPVRDSARGGVAPGPALPLLPPPRPSLDREGRRPLVERGHALDALPDVAPVVHALGAPGGTESIVHHRRHRAAPLLGLAAPVPVDKVARALHGGLPDPPAPAHGGGLFAGELEALLSAPPAEDLRPHAARGVGVPELRGAHPALPAGAVAHQVLVDRLGQESVPVAGAQRHEHVQVGVVPVEGVVDAGVDHHALPGEVADDSPGELESLRLVELDRQGDLDPAAELRAGRGLGALDLVPQRRPVPPLLRGALGERHPEVGDQALVPVAAPVVPGEADALVVDARARDVGGAGHRRRAVTAPDDADVHVEDRHGSRPLAVIGQPRRARREAARRRAAVTYKCALPPPDMLPFLCTLVK